MANQLTISNPFATKYIRPGAIDYIPHDGVSPTTVAERFRESGMIGQIIGPHGSGKTTLGYAVIRQMQDEFASAQVITIRPKKFVVPIWREQHQRMRLGQSSTGNGAIFLLDGIESLSLLQRCCLLKSLRQKRIPAIVTCHRPLKIPVLARTLSSPNRLKQIVERLVVGSGFAIADEAIEACWQRNDGNLREALFDLYDQFETKRRAAA